MGANITYVDITSSKDRVTVSENVTFIVTCPTGSDVLYTLTFGDGSTLVVDENNMRTTGLRSAAEVTSASTVTVTHQVSWSHRI